MKYFLTGATGFIGNRVAHLLLDAGHDLVVLARSPHKAKDLFDRGAVIVQGDITQKDSMRSGMRGTDGIFHMAADYAIGTRNPSVMETINVTGTRNVLELMKELGIAKGVYTSSTAVFSDTHGKLVDESYYFEGQHLTVYDHTKWLAHYDVAKNMIYEGLPLVIVQPSAVYGPRDTSALARMFTDFLRRRLPVLPIRTAFCWAHVEDVARGHIQAMEKGRPGESYILAGPPHTLVEAFDLAAKITRRKPPAIRLGPGIMRFSSRLVGLIEPFIRIPANFSSESLRLTAGTTYIASSEKARRELGFETRELRQGLKGTLTDLAARLNAGKQKN